MKAKLYAAGAFILTILSGALVIFMKTGAANKHRAESLKDSVDKKTVENHKKSAEESFKEAEKHTQKAKEISERTKSNSNQSLEEGVNDWNNDR